MAWHTAAFSGAAQAGKLKPLADYLNTGEQDMTRGAAALLGALHAMKRKGIPMTIIKIERSA